jgi:radical SAM protein with 4Fe4S-binding SPASM domain
MPLPVIQRVLAELWDMGRHDFVGLNQYNEPLLDDRLPEIARFAKSLGFHRVNIISNGDMLTPGLAKELDGNVTHITISGYDNRQSFDEIRGWFKTTHLSLVSGRHRLSHYSPSAKLRRAIKSASIQPCFLHKRNFIVNHQGDCLMCCEEIVPQFDIGNVYRQPLADIWYGDKRQQIIHDLNHPGGRLKYAYCRTCPCGIDMRRSLLVRDCHDHAA